VNEPPRRYVFQPLDTRGVLFGLQPGQLAAMSVGVLLSLGAAQVVGGLGGAAVAGLLVACSAMACLARHSGRSVASWVPVAARWLMGSGGRPLVSQAPLAGARAVAMSLSPRSAAALAVRPPLATSDRLVLAGIDLRELEAEPGRARTGVVVDHSSGSWSAMLPVRGSAFSLLDAEQQVQRLEAWRAVLGTIGRSGGRVRRLQWVEATGQGTWDGLPHAARRTEGVAGAAGRTDDVIARAQRSYEELVTEAGRLAQVREVWIVVSLAHRRGDDRNSGADVRRELDLLQGQLRNAGLRPGEPLDLVGLRGALALLCGGTLRAGGGSRRGRPWPVATEEGWSWYRTDGSWHATYWISEWPRVEVPPDFLTPLLVSDRCRRISVTMAPVPDERAMRQVRSARTADLADAELRSRAGFVPSARRSREADGVARREIELAEGHSEFRFSGYVTVSSDEQAGLAVACADVEHSAQAAHLELRRLYGRQAEAFTWTLPIGRGLT
jgi:hypothetical protein